MDVDVLITGAGPTGLVLACELARRGIGVRILDRRTEHFGGSRADGLMPRTQELLADLGVLDELFAGGDAGMPVRRYRDGAAVWEGEAFPRTEPTPHVPYPGPWFVPQFRTEQVLRDRLAGLGTEVELGAQLVSFRTDSAGVTAALADGSQVRARYLIGADGGASTVRHELGIGFPGTTDESTRAVFADLRITGLDRECTRIWERGGESAMVQPLAGTDLFTASAPGATVAELPQRIRRVSGLDLEIGEITWHTAWRANARLAERFRAGRVFLIGDAAHVCPPTGGQGMNTGIQDAVNLGWKLAAVLRGADPELLDTYEPERRPAAERALRLSERLLAAHRRGDDDAHVRGPELGQLGVHYRASALSVERREQPGRVRAGDRMPDAPCEVDGRRVRLFELLRGPQWTVLDLGGGGLDLPGVQVLAPADPDGHLRAVCGTGALLAIRPDGHLGWCGRSGQEQQLRDYLAPLLAA